MTEKFYYLVAMVTACPEIKRDERGATATEYALLVAGIAIALLAAVTVFGGQLSNFFSGIGDLVGLDKVPTPASGT